MIFTETSSGRVRRDLERREDSELFRAPSASTNSAHGFLIAQSASPNHKKGTLRGMHFQFPPAPETKLVRATRGAILDIIVDLRPESPTFLQHVAVELSEDNSRALYVPERFAHGYQVLRDSTETSYQVGEFYAPGCEGGLMYDDPQLGLQWPLPVTVMSDKDRVWKTLDAQGEEIMQRMATGAVHAGHAPNS
jgi:dTDP-4-dehydrorhamnose 3,5-epimerase